MAGKEKIERDEEKIERDGIADDVLLRIFGLLPLRSLARCACVCSSWNRIVLSLREDAFRREKKRLLEIASSYAYRGMNAIDLEQRIHFAFGSSNSYVTCEAHSKRINCSIWSMDTLATGSSDGTIKIWSASSMVCREEYVVPRRRAVVGLEVDQNKVLGGAGEHVYIWKRNERERAEFGGHGELRSMCYIDPEVAAGCSDGAVRIYDLYSRRCSLIVRPHSTPVNCLAFSSTLNLMVTGSSDSSVQLIDMTSGEKAGRYGVAVPSGVCCLQVLEDGHKIVGGTCMGDLYCWDLRYSCSYLRTFSGNTRPLWKQRIANSRINAVHQRDYAPSVIGCGGADRALLMVDCSSGQLFRRVRRATNSPMLSVRLGCSKAVTCHADGTVTWWKFNKPGEGSSRAMATKSTDPVFL